MTKRPTWLFAVALAATLLVTLAAEPAQATFPGSNGRIAFVRPDHGGFDIFSADPDGSHLRQLTTFAPKHSAYAPSWSADGNRIVFVRDGPHGRRQQIWVMDADGADQHRILSDPWFTDQSPTFSPDGSKILFARCQDDPPPADQGRCAVATVNVDGTRIVFERDNADSSKYGLYTMNPDGTGIIRIIRQAFSAAWQPLGLAVSGG
jgi:hypothetical protein